MNMKCVPKKCKFTDFFFAISQRDSIESFCIADYCCICLALNLEKISIIEL